MEKMERKVKCQLKKSLNFHINQGKNKIKKTTNLKNKFKKNALENGDKN